MMSLHKILNNMENVKRDEFDVNGTHFRLATREELNGSKNTGTSANGIWNVYTDGKEFITIHKSDVLKVNTSNAVELFNGIK